MNDYADTTIRVRYAETDQMGVVYHGNYFTWFEVGRVELCRHLGFEYKQMEIEDDSYIVVPRRSAATRGRRTSTNFSAFERASRNRSAARSISDMKSSISRRAT